MSESEMLITGFCLKQDRYSSHNHSRVRLTEDDPISIIVLSLPPVWLLGLQGRKVYGSHAQWLAEFVDLPLKVQT